MSFDKITEKSSIYNHLENKTVKDLVRIINKEDQSVAKSVSKNLDKIEKLINNIEPRMHKGGRLFYIGAGTSGRLGILDASCFLYKSIKRKNWSNVRKPLICYSYRKLLC